MILNNVDFTPKSGVRSVSLEGPEGFALMGSINTAFKPAENITCLKPSSALGDGSEYASSCLGRDGLGVRTERRLCISRLGIVGILNPHNPYSVGAAKLVVQAVDPARIENRVVTVLGARLNLHF